MVAYSLQISNNLYFNSVALHFWTSLLVEVEFDHFDTEIFGSLHDQFYIRICLPLTELLML